MHALTLILTHTQACLLKEKPALPSPFSLHVHERLDDLNYSKPLLQITHSICGLFTISLFQAVTCLQMHFLYERKMEELCERISEMSL